ncbi:cyclic nucleotide-binding domain-containing protein [Sorangium sp. So ce1389]|uniref:cyclic nucleotide-binding domain-containing protein n=1 Tax=Sorangium sp. So ce1389 TaxID=3133336 RepID=UPI003F63907E
MTLQTTTAKDGQAGVRATPVDAKDQAELQEVLAISPTFRALSAQHIDALLRAARIERIAADTIIGREGERSERLFLILRGDVDAFWGEALREVMLNYNRGGVFGGGVLLDEENVYSFATSRETLVASWDKDALRRAELRAPGLHAQLLKRLSIGSRLAEFAELLQHAPLFRNSSSVLRHRLLQEMTLLEFPSGTTIYQRGEPANTCYLVVNGEVEAKQSVPEDQVEKITVIGRGAVFGDSDLLTSGVRTESAVAQSDTEVLAIDRIDIEALRRACGSFRRAVVARSGSAAAATRPQDLVLVVNRTPYPTRSVASLIQSAFADAGDRNVALLEVAPETADAAGDNVLRIPSDPTRALQVLDGAAQRMGHRYLVLYTTIPGALDWLAQPVWDKIIDNRISSAVYFTDDLRQPFPIETPQLSPVQYIEVRSPGSAKDVHMVRSGSIRLVVDGKPGSDLLYTSLPAQNRAALQRLARTLARQVVGVALGGGAAWGYAHVALLRALHDAGIPIDMVAGTSIGAVVACAYGSRGLEGLDSMVKLGVDFALWHAIAPITRKPLEGLVEKKLIAHNYLQDMPLPTLPVAVDIQRGRARVFRHGRAVHAMFASTAIPTFIIPEIQDGARYVDGGIANNVPVSALVEEGADFIIASNVIPPPNRLARELHKSGLTRILSQLSPLGRTKDGLRAMFLLMHEAGNRQATAAQITWAPSMGTFGMLDSHLAAKIVEHVQPTLPRFIDSVKNKYAAFCRNRDF